MLATSAPLIIALDYADLGSALTMADALDPTRCRVKIGKELFTRAGPKAIDAMHERGFEVFLDLKFHDIPNTAAGAVEAAADRGVWMTNVHAGGGRRMMEACVARLDARGLQTRLIAVTVLTSMADAELHEVGIADGAGLQVERLASLAQQSGLHGVVCSAWESERLRKVCGEVFLKVTPGIRPADSQAGDQRRIMTPEAALAAGSTHLVIGRAVTRAESPMTALAAIERAIATP